MGRGMACFAWVSISRWVDTQPDVIPRCIVARPRSTIIDVVVHIKVESTRPVRAGRVSRGVGKAVGVVLASGCVGVALLTSSLAFLCTHLCLSA